MSVINTCETLQAKTIRNLNKLEVDRQSQEEINEAIDNQIEMVKDLELIESNMLQTVYLYNKQSREEMKQQANEVIMEHRSGKADPTKSKIKN